MTETPRPFWLSPGWWLRDSAGRLVLGQTPNPAILVWMTCVVLGWTDLVANEKVLVILGRGALLAWAADEVLRGASPFRRVLGMVVAGYVLVATFG